ncbi:MAG: ribbon-helix-helix protein, CopG family [Blastocatellia bacterium]
MYRTLRYMSRANIRAESASPGQRFFLAMTTRKKATSVRLSDDARSLIEELARSLGISQTAVLEQAVRRFAKAEGIHRLKGASSGPRRMASSDSGGGKV